MRNMDPMKKDKKESFFLLSISPSSMKLRMISSRTNSVDLPTDFCRKKSGNWQLGGAAEWINSAPAHEEAIGGVALERGVSGKISLSSEF